MRSTNNVTSNLKKKTETQHTTGASYQGDEQVVKNEIDGDEDGHAAVLAGLPHGAVHHFVPTLLSQDLIHRHKRLSSSVKD